MKRLLTIFGILTASLTVNAQIVDRSTDLGSAGQRLALSSPIVVPLSVVASNAKSLIPQGIFMARGQVIEDRRTDREQLVKPFSVFLAERKIDHCELHYVFAAGPQSNVSLRAQMRLDYLGQGAEMSANNKILMAYRIVQERDRTDFAENEITMIRCSTFLPANLSPARVPVSVLLEALGPVAIITK